MSSGTVLSEGAVVGDYTIVARCASSPTVSIFRVKRRTDQGSAAALKVWQRPMPAHLHDAEKVEHPGLTRVLEAGRLPDGRSYCIKEWIEGRSLAEVLAEAGSLSETKAIEICDMLISAVLAANLSGRYFHKFATDDVMVAKEHVKLLDCGIPRDVVVKDHFDPAPSLGPGSVAPELNSGTSLIDGAVEVYALGVLLHEMVVGKLPFQSDADGHKPRGNSVPSASLISVVQRCLEKRRERRFGSLEELRSALRATEVTSETVLSGEQADALAAPFGLGTAPSLDGYEIVGELGRGGMAVVYKARQAALNRWVALKMFVSQGLVGIEELRRFRSEAETIASLQHPNIVQVYETGVSRDNVPYHSLELIEGGSLDRYHGVAMPPREAAHLVETIARAVDYAHRHSVVHRDLKPANVLLSADGTPKVSDFGIAKRVEGDSKLTQTGAIMGTPSFMAPEQARGDTKSIGPGTDVYGLGTILYSLLTGRPPFQAETAAATIHEVIATTPLSPRRLQPDLPRDLEIICLKCLEKDPPERYASAAALAEDLQRYLTDRPISARATPRIELLWRWCRRNRSIAWLTVGVLFAVVAIAVISTLFAFRLAREKRQASENGQRAEENARASERNRNAAANALFAIVTKVDRSLAQRPDSDSLRRELLEEAIARLETIRKSGHAGALEDKTLAIAYERMATVLLRLGRNKDAIDWYKRAIELLNTIGTRDSITYFSLAVSHERAGDAEPNVDAKRLHYQAMQAAVQSLETLPRDAEVPAERMLLLRAATFARLARMKLDAKDYRPGIDDYLRAAAAGQALASLPPAKEHWFFTSDKDNVSAGRSFAADAYLHVGDCLFEALNDKEGALANYRKASAETEAALGHDPENAGALGRRGMLSYRIWNSLFVLGRQREAREMGKQTISQLEAALRFDPSNLDVHFTLMIAEARAGLHVRASAEIAQLRKKVQGIDIGVAEVFAQCAFGIAQGRPRDRLSSSEGLLYDRYLAEAIAILRQMAKSHELPVQALTNEFELQPVRDSPEYESLTKEATAHASAR
jgi:serine/threonine protein kinase